MRLIVYWKRKARQTKERWYWQDVENGPFGRSTDVQTDGTPVSKTRADEYLVRWSTHEITEHVRSDYTIHAEPA